MDPSTGRYPPTKENPEVLTPKQLASNAHSEREVAPPQQQGPEHDDPNKHAGQEEHEERRFSGERIKFLEDRKGSLISLPVDHTAPKVRGSILRKSGQRFSKTVDDPSMDPIPSAGSVGCRKESSGSVFSCQDRHSSRRMKRKPSLMSITISQCSDAGPGRQFTLFHDSPAQSSKVKKRDSVASTGSVKAAILKPSIMAEGEMFSECQRRKKWLMAIHASNPDEALPLLKKPVFFVDEGGKVTKEAVTSLLLRFAQLLK